ncbi:MAG TPA: bifunctional folylpolyglutamate synthase/dihydrofolate synthase [Campylobacteraceae bacterium]|nr:bifunctional folylpolyglutamate synthase/dihydrofolate synthase [Campylobacteraceae bacterium]
MEPFLAQKPLYYDEIDYDRFPRIWERYASHFNLPRIIHIIGTNGKGSTGRFLAHYLWKCGIDTGHYTSPHILRFNERIWRNGSDVDDATLETHHQKLLQILDPADSEAMSYFEYTTLLAVSILQDCEYIVMEAGLGGEHDATAVFDKDLTLVTPIGIDHQSFLGDSLEAIARTKLNAIRKFAILGKQQKPVYKLAKEYAEKRKIDFFRYTFFFTKEEMAKARRTIRNLALPSFFVDNLLLGLAGAKFFGFDIKWKAMEDLQLFGRAQWILPNVMIDVGHNPLAASALADTLKKREIVLVYNSYADKDYRQILEIFKPIVKRVEILPIYNQRIESQERLQDTITSLKIPFREFEEIDPHETYLVFGSFAVAEEFLKHYVPETQQ